MKTKALGVIYALLSISLSCFAGDITVVSGDLSIIRNSSVRATVKFDYSELILEGKPYMEHLKSRGEDFVNDWPSESTASEAYFIRCWNKDNDEGMQVSTSESSEYLMYFHVKEMHMGSGAASMLVGFGAGGASMSGTMYIFKNLNSIPVLTVEIDDQTGRSGMTEIVRRTDLYGELAEDLVKTLKKAKQSKIKPSTMAVKVPNVTLIENGTAIVPTKSVASKVENIEVSNKTNKEVVAKKETPTPNVVSSNMPILENGTYEKEKGISQAIINAKSDLTLNKKGEAGSVEELVSEKRLSIYIDYSEALLNNKSIDDFIEFMETSVREKERDANFRTNWETKYRNSFTLAFIDKANEALADEDQIIRLTTKQDCKYALKISVIEFDDNGNNTCDYLLVNTETGNVIAHYRLEADGGRVGKYIGLLEQGHASAGEVFGEFLAEKIDKIKD